MLFDLERMTDGDLEDELEEQAEEYKEDQDEEGKESDDNGIDDETMFPDFVPFLGLLGDMLVAWNEIDRKAVEHIWILSQRNKLPRTRKGLNQLKLTKILCDLCTRFAKFRLQGNVLHRGGSI